LSRLRWAGHVIRQDDHDLARRVLSGPGGKLPTGGPRLRWGDRVKEDVAKLGCRNWTGVGLNLEGWRKLLKEAEDHYERRWRGREKERHRFVMITRISKMHFVY
jgi:hypothetical protein